MQNEKKYFLSPDSMLDSDSADFAVSPNSWVNSENVRTGSTDAGVIGTVESVGSTATISSQAPGESYICIGSAEDTDNQRFVTFYYDNIGNNDKIECCYTDTNTVYTVLKSSDITGTGSSSFFVESFSDSVYSTAPNTIVFTDAAAVALMAIGDRVVINGTNVNGTYTIANIVGTTITTVETVPTTITGESYPLYTSVLPGVDGFNFTGIRPAAINNIHYPPGTEFVVSGGTPVDGTYHVDGIGTSSTYWNIGTLETTPITYTGDAVFTFKTTGTIVVYRENVNTLSGLNFTTQPIHSARIVNGCLYWVDSTNNQPRKINIDAGIKAYQPTFVTTQAPYSFPLEFSEITIIKPTASLSPNIVKNTDAAFLNNFIANDSFEFAFQYIYDDNETTVTGTYSPSSRLNFPSDTFNFINVTMDLSQQIPSTVKIVNLIARMQDGTAFGGNYAFVVKTWDRSIAIQESEIEAQNTGFVPLGFDFYNNTTGQLLASDDVLRPFDNVPIYSQTLEAAKNRIFLANNTEGYATPKATSLSVSLANPVVLSNANQAFLLFKVQYSTSGINTPGIFFLNKRRRMQYAAWCIYLSTTTTPGYYAVTATQRYASSDAPIQHPNQPIVYPNLIPPGTPIPTAITFNDLVFIGTNLSEIVTNTKFSNTAGSLNPDSAIAATANPCTVTALSTNKYNVFAQRSSYKFGVVFYDFAMRKSGVVGRTDAIEPVLTSTFIDTGLESLANVIQLTSDIALSIVAGDILEITGSTFDGTYNVTAVTYTGTDTFATVIQNIGTNTATTGTVSIYKLPVLDITTPTRNYDYSTAFSAIQWSLGNTNVLSEIPDWAYYYTVVRTLNLRTRFFFQAWNNNAKYATKNTDGTYNFTNNTYSALSTVAIALNTDSLKKAGLGYVYSEKDSCILVVKNPSGDDYVYDIPVIGQADNYILLKAKDIGTLLNTNLIYEIYTPYQSTDQEPYFEMGEMYEIANPGTLDRNYTISTGLFKSDAYAFERIYGGVPYFAGAMSPNDLYYKRWDTDAGKSNFITKLGQAVKQQYISWSDVYIPNTAVNGLSTFRAFNETSVPQDCGAISKLQLTSKVQSEGTVMLSICTAETNSMYLGETQITDSTGGTQFFSATTNVISTINTLKGSFGTINPEGVVEFRGSVYYPDANRGVWVQYSSNGLFPISSYRMTRFWKLFFAQYISMTAGEIEALGSRPYIFATMDASHMELVISIPKLLETPPKGYLPDYPEMIYPFDIWDGQGKTIVYNLETAILPQPHWQGSYSFNPEWFVSLSNKLYSLKDGNLYQHNQTDSYNNFYGTQYSSKIMVIANQLSTKPKTYNNVSVESNKVPDFVYFYNNYPYIQTSDLIATDFRDLEGVFYATLFRNKIIPTNSGFTTDGLLIGEYMRNVAMKILFQFEAIDTPLELKYLNIGYTLSRGHTV